MTPPRFWRQGRSLWPFLLAPAGCLYDHAGRLRHRWTSSWRAPIPVVCVGNLTAGGTGKTPIAVAIAQRLTRAGVRAHLLTRGYGGRITEPTRVDPSLYDAGDVGDEALLLAREAPTWVARDRVTGARAAMEAGAAAIVMDDGFQNPGIAKDLSFVVVDGEEGFGNGRIMPAGPLREPVDLGLARAGAVIVVGADTAGVAARVRAARPELPVFACRLVPRESGLAGVRVYGFAGIGRPEKFAATLREIGGTVTGFRPFADHHAFSAREIADVLTEARHLDARPVTTAKDFVRLPKEAQDRVTVVEVEAAFEDEAALDAVLAPVLRRR